MFAYKGNSYHVSNTSNSINPTPKLASNPLRKVLYDQMFNHIDCKCITEHCFLVDQNSFISSFISLCCCYDVLNRECS